MNSRLNTSMLLPAHLRPLQPNNQSLHQQPQQLVLAAFPPDHPLPASWVCPVSGLSVPKGTEANLQYRQQIRAAAAASSKLQNQLRFACKSSCLYWINTFCWTYRQKITNENGEEVPTTGHHAHVPFVTWPNQDEVVTDLIAAINHGEDRAVRKSRDMGATWVIQAVLHWMWQFQPNVTFLELSRKEDLVDKKGDMDSLFEKHRYLLKWQPRWLLPAKVRDTYMNLQNLELGNAIIGESTNQHAGQGGRKTAIMLDEFGRVDNAEEIELSTADTSACRIFNSTPTGPGTGFHKLVTSGRVKVLEMMWWRHPEKGAGAHQIVDPVTKKPKWVNEWYEKEASRRSKKDLAQNIDGSFGAAGEIFFDADETMHHRMTHVRAPNEEGELEVRDLRDSERKMLVAQRKHDWCPFLPGHGRRTMKLWMPLVNGRLNQGWRYVIACDISNGSGSSNSVAEVLCLETNRVVAELADAFLSPEDFAWQVIQLGVWVGGANGLPLLIWENNGPGGIFGRKVAKSGYPRFYRQKIDDTVREKRTSRWGWNSNDKKKEVLLGRLREEIKTGGIVVPNEKVLDELLDYVYTETGKLEPGKLKSEKGGGKALHGDRVIATALLLIARDEAPKAQQGDARAAVHSFAWRRQNAKRRQTERDAWN
jgi:hypothetical protein